MKKHIVSLIIALVFTLPLFASASDSFPDRVRGKILLRVESKGEAWYVNPTDGKRYFLGRPRDALQIMRKLGLRISDSNLAQLTKNGWKMYVNKQYGFMFQHKDGTKTGDNSSTYAGFTRFHI